MRSIVPQDSAIFKSSRYSWFHNKLIPEFVSTLCMYIAMSLMYNLSVYILWNFG